MKEPSGAVMPGDPAIAGNFEYRRLADSLARVFQEVKTLHQGGVLRHPAAAQPMSPMTDLGDTTRRKTALHLAYFFPPIGGAGAQRSLKLVRYLSEFAYESIVISGPGNPPGGRWTPADATLSLEVAPSTVVHRVPRFICANSSLAVSTNQSHITIPSGCRVL